MKFTLFFILLLSFIVHTICTIESPYSYILMWPATNMVFMASAYLLNNPSFVMGKKKNGHINFMLLVINLPWLFLTWLIFKIQILISQEDFCNNIKGTNIWLSRRPFGKDNFDKFEIVVDLTCEFPPDKSNSKYICYPNLDGHILSHLPEIKELPKDKNILIHCANGHGRSALFSSILLEKQKIVQTLDEGLKLILKNRRLARPNSSQKKWLLAKIEKEQ